MPTIYDNRTQSLAPALRDTMAEATSLDVCVGYLNLRGWRELADAVDALPWATGTPAARVLVGMSILPADQLRQRLRIRPDGSTWEGVTNEEIPALRTALIDELGSQLTVGFPTDEDEVVVRQLARQVREGRVALKFFACGPLHAKLYLAHLASTAAPRKAFVGSSNLTFAGLVNQGELSGRPSIGRNASSASIGGSTGLRRTTSTRIVSQRSVSCATTACGLGWSGSIFSGTCSPTGHRVRRPGRNGRR